MVPGGADGGGRTRAAGGRRCRCWTMANPSFDLGDLVNNPNFNFINHFANQPDQDDSPFDFSDSPYTTSTFDTQFIDSSTFISTYKTNNNLKLLSLNIQSLPAKYNELRSFIISLSTNNCAPEIIALQEIWQVIDASHFPLPGYQPLLFTTRSKGQQTGKLDDKRLTHLTNY